MIDAKKFREVPDWLLGGYWPDQDYLDLDGNLLSTKEFGSNRFHGRSHPSVGFMAISRFTEMGDLVYIPFAGSGTEIDVCKKYGRRYIAIDINPCRDDVIKGDATQFRPPETPNLVIAHPPYSSSIVYGDAPNDLSKSGMDYDILSGFCSQVFSMALDPGGILVLIIGDTYHDGQEWPLDYVWHQHLTADGFKLIGRIVRDFGETKGKGKDANLWKYRLLKFKRFHLKNDFVMIYEKTKLKKVKRD